MFGSGIWQFCNRCILKAGGAGIMACLITSACAQVEYTGPKRYYSIDNANSDNEMHLRELTKIKKDPMHWGTMHFASSNPEKKDITVDFGKEKYGYRPSRYYARTSLPEKDGKSLGLTLSVDSKRDAWMGVEFKFKTDFWSPHGGLK